MNMENLKIKVVGKAKEVGQFCKENMVDLAGTVTIVATGLFSIGAIAKAIDDGNKAFYDKDRCWYVKVNRKMSNFEMSNILRDSRENGKTLTEILCERDLIDKVFGSGTNK